MATLFAFLLLLAESESPTTLSPGQKIQSKIEATDALFQTESLERRPSTLPIRAKKIQINLERSGIYHFVVASHDFDSYLVLLDRSGEVLAEDDDGWIPKNSLITEDLLHTERYSLLVCALEGGIGSFEVSFLEGEASDPTAVEISEWLFDARSMASMYRYRAAALLDANDISGAHDLTEKALNIAQEKLGDNALETASCLQQLGRIMLLKNDLPRSRALLEKAGKIQEKQLGFKDPQVWTSFALLGQAIARQGSWAESETLIRRVFESANELITPDQSKLNYSRILQCAEASYLLGDWRLSGGLFQKCANLAEKFYGKDSYLVAHHVATRGSCLFFEGNYAQARIEYERALAILEEGGESFDIRSSLVPIRTRLAEIVLSEGNFDYAQRLFEGAIKDSARVFGERSLRVALTLLSLGELLYVRGSQREAKRIIERSIDILREVLGDSDNHFLVSAFCRLAQVDMRLSDLSRAASHLIEAQNCNRGNRGPFSIQDKVEIELAFGELRYLEGRFESARKHFETAVEIGTENLEISRAQVNLALQMLSRLLREQGGKEEAWQFAKRALVLAEEDLFRVSWALSESERYQFVMTQRLALDWVLDLSLELGTSDALALAFESLCRWKARVAAGMSATRSEIFRAKDPSIRSALARLRSIQSQISDLLSGYDASNVTAYAARLGSLRKARVQLEQQLERWVGSKSSRLAPDWKSFQRVLPNNATFVNFIERRRFVPPNREGGEAVTMGHWDELEISAWVLNKRSEHPAHIAIGKSSSVESLGREFLSELVAHRPVGARPKNSNLIKLNQAVCEKVWAPLRQHLGGNLLLISSDGFLGSLPLGVLQQEEGRYLIEDYQFVSLQDPEDLIRFSQRQRGQDVSLLAIGGVDYQSVENSDSNGRSETSLPQGSIRQVAPWMPLPGTIDEAKEVTSLHAQFFSKKQSELLSGTAPTEARLKVEFPRFPFIHIATHAFFSPGISEALGENWARVRSEDLGMLGDYPASVENLFPGLLSGIVCAGANSPEQIDGENGLLTAEEVSWLDLSKVDLVFLSACQTGLGAMRAGEDMIGLKSSFRQAGVKTVVSALWSIGDQSAKEIAKDFYRSFWVEGRQKVDALRDAQLRMLNKQRAFGSGNNAPVAWGAFTLDGDWQ